MIDIAICDDDVGLTMELEKIIVNIAAKCVIDVNTDVYWDGEGLADSIINGEQYDIIYLDVEMKKENGIDAARRIRKIDETVLIIYVTNYEIYAIKTFELRPFRYVLKPIQLDEFREVTIAAIYETQCYETYFHYQFGRHYRKIRFKDIMYFESNKRKINIVTIQHNGEDNIKNQMCKKINILETELKGGKIHFLRIHQSYLVSNLYIQEVAYDHIVLTNGINLPISEERRKGIRSAFLDIDAVLH